MSWLRPRVEVAAETPLGDIPATLTPYGMPPPAPSWLSWELLGVVAGALALVVAWASWRALAFVARRTA